jgi:fumarate reductase subunit D
MARSAKAIPWFLFAAGGTITAFVLPVMLFVTNLAPPLGLFRDALSWETMSSFVGFWLVRLVLFGIIGFGLWHAAHRLRSCAHDFGIRADDIVAVVLYGLAGIGSLLTIWALLRI